ncbi:cyclophilin-like domain-containing protein [Chytriomyces cf. hyalinus JEL632]|nr:cyclophilin-like domain-containing protein [Chytriomyces cf. hyalinus JEL632]
MAQAFITFQFTAQDATHQSQLESYEFTQALLSQNLDTLGGIPPETTPNQLTTDQIEVLSSIHAATSSTLLSFISPGPPPPSTLVLNLFSNVAPKAVTNFLRLCDGSKGVSKASKKPLHYLGNRVHRIVEGYIVQWGDIVKGDGSSGDSIYGGKFNDEPQALKLPISRGSLVMANSGKHSNTSQVFLVLSNDAERIRKNMQGKHVVLGHVYGLGVGDDLLDPVAQESGGVFERLGCVNDGTELLIKNCGVLRE